MNRWLTAWQKLLSECATENIVAISTFPSEEQIDSLKIPNHMERRHYNGSHLSRCLSILNLKKTPH